MASAEVLTGKKCSVFSVVAIVLIVVGILGIALSTYYWKEEEEKEIHGRFGVVFDAGGSGTRMYLYEYKNNKEYVQTFQNKCEDKGLTTYSENTQSLQPLLSKCLEDAVTKLPSDVSSANVPLFMKATAGMRKLRLLNETEYNSIWKTVRNILSNGSFPVKFADTMPGTSEAKYSWTTINELLGNQESRGLLEVGSTSLQIAFEPSSSSNLIPSNYSEEVSINGKNYKIYVHSYLCMGRTEFGRRFYAKLAMDKFVNNSSVISNPCGYQGYSVNKTVAELFQAPCVKGDFAKNMFGKSLFVNTSDLGYLTFVGAGNFLACKAQVESMFFNNCSFNSCGTLGVFQPQAHGQYLGIGGGAFYAADFLGLPSNYNISDFEIKTEELCAQNFTEVKNRRGYSKFSDDYCLSNTYTNFILQNILKLNETVNGKVSFASKVNGEKLSWTLGSIIDDHNQMSAPVLSITRELGSTDFYVIVVISAILVVTGILLILTCLCCYGKQGSVNNKTV